MKGTEEDVGVVENDEESSSADKRHNAGDPSASHTFTTESLERKRLALELSLERRRQLQALGLQKFLTYFACLTLGSCCLTTLALFVLQGFHTAGFNLDRSLMHWMGVATIGAIGGLALIVYKRLL